MKEAVERMSEKQMEDAYNQVFCFHNWQHKDPRNAIQISILLVQVVEMMVQLYHVCHLVHADLSE